MTDHPTTEIGGPIRSEVLSFRVGSEGQAAMLRLAAAAMNENLSEFLRVAALQRMNVTLANRRENR